MPPACSPTIGSTLARLQLQEALRALTQRLSCPVVIDVDEFTGGVWPERAGSSSRSSGDDVGRYETNPRMGG
jgi:hypothetical protein